MDFQIGHEVEFYGEVGRITSIESLPKDLKVYNVSYFVDGEPKRVGLYDFEMRAVGDNSFGYSKQDRRKKE